MLSAIILVVVALVFFIKLNSDKKVLREFAEKLPGPRPWPLIGNLLMFAVPRKDIFTTFYNIHKQYETPSRYWMGPNLYIGIDKPEHIETIMTSPIASQKAEPYSIIADCIGYGLIQSNGTKHKMHRKLMILPLKGQILDKHMEKFNLKGQECADLLKEKLNMGTFEVFDAVDATSMALVTEIIMGVVVNSSDPENHKLVQTVSGLYKSIAERIYRVWLHPYITYRFSKLYKEQKDGMKIFNKFLNDIVDKKEEELSNSNHQITDEEAQNISLEWFLHVKNNENKPYFSRQEILEELSSLFTASEDTTATITSFVLLMLAIHKDIQQQVYEEQIHVMGSNDPSIPIRSDHLVNMRYLHMVIQEVLRLYPVAPTLLRKLTTDFKLGEIKIPKEAILLIHIFSLHKNERIWPDPEKFDPLRFTPEEKAKRHPYSYLPFSGGIRGCIGKQFAFMAIKCFISHIIRRYVINTKWKMEDVVLEADISVRSTNGYKISIEKRTLSSK